MVSPNGFFSFVYLFCCLNMKFNNYGICGSPFAITLGCWACTPIYLYYGLGLSHNGSSKKVINGVIDGVLVQPQH